MMNKDELEGKVDQMKGKFKQAVGRATDDPNLEDEGAADETAGDVQSAFGQAKRKAGEVVEDIGKSIKR